MYGIRRLQVGRCGELEGLSSRPTVARVVTREHRRGRGTLHQQSRKATPGGAAQAERRNGSEFAKRMSSGDARRRHRRSPRTRTPLNGLTKKSTSADRRGRGTLQRKVEKRLERRRGSGMCPVKQEASPFWASLLVRNRLQELFLASLVSLVEHINSAGAVDDLHLAGVERVRCV